MSISISYDSRAYLHIGGTKYYRLASISIANRETGKTCHALLTNYGSYKRTKGDLSHHKPIHGGTSSIEYFTNETSLANKLNSEAIRRRSRSYDEEPGHRAYSDVTGRTEMGLQDALRGTLGIISGHYDEILVALGMKVSATAPAMDDVLETARKKMEAEKRAKFAAKAGKTVEPDTSPPWSDEKALSSPKMSDIDRGEVWGSW